MLRQIYLAAPFFNPAERMLVERMEKILTEGKFSHFSPSRDQTQFTGHNIEFALTVFKRNIHEMNKADTMIACIDDFDPGTVFEMGFFYHRSKYHEVDYEVSDNLLLLAFSNAGHGLNIMLSEAVDGFFKSIEELQAWLSRPNVKTLSKWKGDKI